MNRKFELAIINFTNPVICSLLILENINTEMSETYYSTGLILSWFFARFYGRSIDAPLYQKIFIPTAYLILAFGVNIFDFGLNLYLIFDPVLYAYLTFIAGLLTVEKGYKNELKYAALIVVYSFIIPVTHKYHRLITNPYIKKEYDFGVAQVSEDAVGLNVDTLSLYLDDIVLYNKYRDTLTIQTGGKYTVLETWNEKCPPCLIAMKDLESFYNTDKFTQKYIYVRPDKKKDIDFDKMFNSDIVSKKSEKHLVDYDEILYQNGLQGTPYFLVFDPDGQLVFKQLGYDRRNSDKLRNQISQIINN